MSARQQFQFPPTSPQPPTFAPDAANPLHGASDKSMTEQVSSSARTTTTGGLAAIMNRKRSHPAPVLGSAAAMNPLARPGTADPYSRNSSSNFAKGQIPVVAPTPQALRSSPLLARGINSKMNSGFKVPSMFDSSAKPRSSGENNAHIPTMDATSFPKNDGEMFSMTDSDSNATEHVSFPNLKFNPGSFNTGARRVSITNESGNFDNGETYPGESVVPGHEVTQDGRVKAINPLKRMRDEMDDDGDDAPYEPSIKRYKHDQTNPALENLDLHLRQFSPQTAERPSSGLSRSDHYRTNRSASGDLPHFAAQRQRFSRSPSMTHKSTPSPYQPQPIMRRQEPGALTRLLGQDPDVFVQENMAEYDEMVKRWSNCTMDEWIAGADEIMSHYTKIFDMVKERVRAKLRLYGSIHENIDKHNALLRERSQILASTKQKLVEDGGSVLKR